MRVLVLGPGPGNSTGRGSRGGPRLLPLAGEEEATAAFGGHTITVEGRRIPDLHLSEPRCIQRGLDLLFGPADFFHSLSVAPPEMPLAQKPFAITPCIAALQTMAISHGENQSGLLIPVDAPPIFLETCQIVEIEEEPCTWIERPRHC